MSSIVELHNEEERYYITKTCYVRLDTHDLVNLEKTKRVTGQMWTLLHYLMERPNVIVSYEEISQRVWQDNREKKAINSLMFNLRRFNFEVVGVDKNSLENVFQIDRGNGVSFHPYRICAVSPENNSPRSLIEIVKSSRIPEKDFAELIDCLLNLGLDGRMGRERLIRLAHSGNKLAALELGEQFYYGRITPNHQPNFEQACRWYAKAGDHPVALWSLGYCIKNNFYPVVDPNKIDYLRAKQYFDRTLQVANGPLITAAAMTSIGELWELGHYPAQDFAETGHCENKDNKRAQEYYKEADELGYHYATNRRGLYYEKQNDISPSEVHRQKAYAAFKRSVELAADGYALNKLGLYYEKGFGCDVDADKACECFMRGVEETLEEDRTGWNYFNAGRVCAKRIQNQSKKYYDLVKAFDYFDKAMHMLPVEEHEQILLEMLEILTLESTHAQIPTSAILLTRSRVDSYLHIVDSMKNDKKDSNEKIRKKALWLEQLLSDARIKI